MDVIIEALDNSLRFDILHVQMVSLEQAENGIYTKMLSLN